MPAVSKKRGKSNKKAGKTAAKATPAPKKSSKKAATAPIKGVTEWETVAPAIKPNAEKKASVREEAPVYSGIDAMRAHAAEGKARLAATLGGQE